MLRQHPWLLDCWTEADQGSHGHGQEEAHSTQEQADQSQLDHHAIEDILAEMERRRAEFAVAMPSAADSDDFRVSLTPGVLESQRNCVRGSARGSLAQTFCNQLRVPKTASFEVSRYSEALAGVLARAWAHGMQYIFDLENVSGSSGRKFTRCFRTSHCEKQKTTDVFDASDMLDSFISFQLFLEVSERSRAFFALFAIAITDVHQCMFCFVCLEPSYTMILACITVTPDE